MRIFDGLSGKDVAAQVGVSEPTISRRLQKVRDLLRSALSQVIATYSFTDEEYKEAERNGLALNPKASGDKADDALFDEAIGEIYHQQMELRRADQLGM
jgi:AcrR family transcriptional regulator